LYFWRAEAYLIDPTVAVLSKPAAIALALAVMLLSWLLYDALCRSPLARNTRALAAVLALVLAVEAWGLCHVFSGRGAYMVFGAALGSIMVANVLMVIIPGQRELVNAKREGREPDAAPGLRGKQRSVHNTYFTLPVLFVMISNHYAMTYGARHNWLVLIALCFAGACIRAWFVARHHAARRGGHTPALPAVLGAASFLAVIIALAPSGGQGSTVHSPMAAAQTLPAQQIIATRCAPCHAQTPTQPGFSAAPNGLVFENLEQIRAHLPEVRQQLIARSMPLGNLTGITESERAVLLDWVTQAEDQQP